MTLNEAIAIDRGGDLQNAAAAYEDVLLLNPGDLTAIVNLVVLLWQSTDPGISAAKHLPTRFISYAGKRFRELLETARARFPNHPELLFWKKYIDWAELNEPFDIADCREKYSQNPQYLEPAFVLFSRSAGLEAEADAMRLLERCSADPTARCRFVASVINGVVKRR